VSHTVVKAVFREYSGKSPIEFLHWYRIGHSIMPLITSERESIDIAYAVGFNHYSNFFRAFRRIVGASPQELLEYNRIIMNEP
jgi:AraC-like DNA-binding protein